MKSNLKVCKVTVTYKSKTIIVNYFRFQDLFEDKMSI